MKDSKIWERASVNFLQDCYGQMNNRLSREFINGQTDYYKFVILPLVENGLIIKSLNVGKFQYYTITEKGKQEAFINGL